MKTSHARWYEIVIVFIVGLLLARPIGNFMHGVNDLVSDAGFHRFENEHHLPHGYTPATKHRLAELRRALFKYSQHHNGDLSLLKSAALVRQKLSVYTHEERCFTNLVGKPFQPNTSIANYQYSQIKNPDHVVLFYDESPPDTYPQVYFVTVSGRGEDVSSNDWIRLQRVWQENQRIEKR